MTATTDLHPSSLVKGEELAEIRRRRHVPLRDLAGSCFQTTQKASLFQLICRVGQLVKR